MKILIDARTADSPSSNYRPFTLRLALWDALCDHLTRPGASLVISSAHDAKGEPVSIRSLQITAAQVIPKDWKVFTERTADNELAIYRWS